MVRNPQFLNLPGWTLSSSSKATRKGSVHCQSCGLRRYVPLFFLLLVLLPSRGLVFGKNKVATIFSSNLCPVYFLNLGSVTYTYSITVPAIIIMPPPHLPPISDPAGTTRCPPGLPWHWDFWQGRWGGVSWSSPVASASSQVIIAKQMRRVSLGVAIKIFGSDRGGSPREARAKIIVEEQSCKRSKSFVQKHPRLQPNMRSVLLDWLIEVRLQLCPYFTLQILEYNFFSFNFQSSFHLHCSNYFLFIFKQGERCLHTSPADVLPGSRLFWSVHADPKRCREGHAAAHWDNLSVYSIKGGGEWDEKWHL